MARSEAQKNADAKYAKKIRGKYKPFIVNLDPAELARMDEIIKGAGMKKAEFLRWAVAELEKRTNDINESIREGVETPLAECVEIEWKKVLK